MIQSILDTDLYKFSTSWAYFNLYPLAEGTFKFNDRNKENWKDCPEFMESMRLEFTKLNYLKLKPNELSWCIKNIPYIPASYWEWLQTFSFDSSKINFWLDEDGVFQCEVTDTLYKVTLYEIAILATYAEVRNKIRGFEEQLSLKKVDDLIKGKITYANKHLIPFNEFGTRRRFSSLVMEVVLDNIKEHSNTCLGTSNVYYAFKYNMTPCGTFPHEWIMFHAAVFGYKMANYLGLEDWIKLYDGNLGTALIDTYTTKSFLKTLTKKQALSLTGFRQDSGDEYEIGNYLINRLIDLGIDPKSKMLIFSNSLDFGKACDLLKYFKGKIKVLFGIGTNLTCDPGIENYTPANIVMKLSKCRMSDKDLWENCIKISDDAGKFSGDTKELEIAKHELHLL